MGMKKLENMEYKEASTRGKISVLGIIDHLQVGEGLRIINFASKPEMREMVSYLEKNKPIGCWFKSRSDEYNGSYVIRRDQ